MALPPDPSANALSLLAPRWRIPGWVRFLNKVSGKLGLPIELRLRFDHHRDMMSLEQVANVELLLGGLLDREVPGDVVELGCYTGSSAAVIAKVLQAHGSDRAFHVYDRFDIDLGGAGDIRAIYDRTIAQAGVPAPQVHAGDLFATVPAELPDRIAFAHIDLGVGAGSDVHAKLIGHALEHVHPRVMKGGIVLLMDHHDPQRTIGGNDSNPGVKIAADKFLAGRPERIRPLYGGPCSHAYYVKA